MEESVDSYKCKGKGKAMEDESLGCPRCSRIFTSAPALCAHQNSHRFLREVLNNPVAKHADDGVSKMDECEKDGMNSELIQDNFALIGARGDEGKKKKKKRKRTTRSRRNKKQIIEVNGKAEECCEGSTADLLREWTPVAGGFGSEICHFGATYSGSSYDYEPMDLELRLGSDRAKYW